jgi:hypothetical protein
LYQVLGGIRLPRAVDLSVNLQDMSIDSQKIEAGKVKIIILDGVQGKVKMTEAVEHGLTIIETVKGRVVRVKFEESELY